jgi:hypothetical protein
MPASAALYLHISNEIKNERTAMNKSFHARKRFFFMHEQKSERSVSLRQLPLLSGVLESDQRAEMLLHSLPKK